MLSSEIQEEIKNENYAAAITHLQELLINIDHGNASAIEERKVLVYCLLQQDQKEQAIQEVQILSEIYRKQCKYERVEECCTFILKISQDLKNNQYLRTQTYLLLAKNCYSKNSYGEKEDLDTVIKYVEQAIEHAKKTHDESEGLMLDAELTYRFVEVANLFLPGLLSFRQQVNRGHEISELLCKRALALTDPQNKVHLIVIHFTLASYYFEKGKKKEAIEYIGKACQMAKELEPKEVENKYWGLYDSFWDTIYFFCNDEDRYKTIPVDLVKPTLLLCQEAIKLGDEAQNSYSLLVIYGWLGKWYYQQALLKEADSAFRKGIEVTVAERDEYSFAWLKVAFYYLSKSVRIIPGAQTLYHYAAFILMDEEEREGKFDETFDVTMPEFMAVYNLITQASFSHLPDYQVCLKDLKNFMQLVSDFPDLEELPKSSFKQFLQNPENFEQFKGWRKELDNQCKSLQELIETHPNYRMVVIHELADQKMRIKTLEDEVSALKKENIELKRKIPEQDSLLEQPPSKKRKITDFFREATAPNTVDVTGPSAVLPPPGTSRCC
jgi:hypothetical protein